MWKKFFLSNAHHHCHGNQTNVNSIIAWLYHGGATSIFAKFGDETAKYRKVVIHYMEKYGGGGGEEGEYNLTLPPTRYSWSFGALNISIA